MHPAQKDIETALKALIHRKYDDAFVIIQDPESERFIQFAGGPSLCIDLPCVALSAAEAERAAEAFAELGVDGPSEYGDPGSTSDDVARYGASYQKDFGDDVALAAGAAIRIMREVYELPEDAALRVIDN